MSDQVELQTEDLELHTEGLFSWVADKFAELYTGDSEWVVVDFDVPDVVYNSLKGVFECKQGSNNRTLKLFCNGLQVNIRHAIDEIKHASSGYYHPKQTLEIIDKVLSSWYKSLKQAISIVNKKKGTRKFRLPKNLLEKKQLPHEFYKDILHAIYKQNRLYRDDDENSGQLIPIVYNILMNKIGDPSIDKSAQVMSNMFFNNINLTADLISDIIKNTLNCSSQNLSLEDADVEVPETQAEAQPSTNIEVTLPERMDGVKKQLDLYAYLIKYLQQYKQDPHKTIGALMEDEQIPNREDFQDVKDALVGAFTSEKATILGCQKLVNLIETTAEAIRKDYVYLSNSTINSSVHDVISNINSIIETTDPGMLEKRKLMYRQNNVTLKYGNYKLEKSIQPYLQELSASMTMVDYLKRIRELQHSLKLDTLKDLEEKIRKYKYNNVFIANNNVYIGKSQFMKNIIEQDTTPPEEVSSLEAMKTFILKVDVSQDHDTVAIDILDNIIENFGNTLSGLKRSVEDFNKLLNSIGDASSKLTDTLDILTDKYIKPYADNTLLKDEFITSYQHCMQAMNNCLTNDKNIIIHILYSAHKLNVLLNNYSYIYSLLEKLTVEMTITEKSSISE